MAKERCDDKAGNVKDVCVKEARAAAVAAKADAKAKLKTANANDQAARTSAGVLGSYDLYADGTFSPNGFYALGSGWNSMSVITS